MITYFNLNRPASELLLGENETYKNREYKSCPVSTEHREGNRRRGPLSVRLKHDSHKETMIWCWVEGSVVHERLLAEFEKRGFTGYATQPAKVRFRDGFVSTEYREFIVTGWAGVASPESGVRVERSCEACHWKQYSAIADYEKLIDWTQWTGDDFFIVWPLPRFTLVTERVAMFLLENAVKSFTLKSLDDSDRPIGARGFAVGRLSNYMPEDLAIKYGKELDLE